MRIVVIGAGYVGLVTGACLSELGCNVCCVDIDAAKVAKLTNGHIPIFEPGLEELVAANMAAGRLSFSASLASKVPNADVVFIAVGTPTRHGNGHCDLSHVYAAARTIAGSLRGYTVVVNKSTVPVGTGQEVADIIRSTRPDASFDVVSNPEFLREGSAVADFMQPDRVVVGVESERAREVMRQVYRPLHMIETPILFTSVQAAELIKYASNSFLAAKITFVNELADLCERLGTDVQEVALGVGLDRRIGPKFLQPGPGYGGSCFPKDTVAFATTARDAGAPLRIIETVIDLNEERKRGLCERVVSACHGSVSGKTIAVLGLTFKANTDDMREAPSLELIPALLAKGARVQVYDPQGMDAAKRLLDDSVIWCGNAYETVTGASAVVILTEWNEFCTLPLDRIKRLVKEPVMVDLRNIYTPAEMVAAGFRYHSVGRPVAQAVPARPAFRQRSDARSSLDGSSAGAANVNMSEIPA